MTGLPLRWASLLLVAAPVLSARLAPAQQTVAPDVGCVQHKGAYTCNWSNFRLTFDRAATVATEVGPMDRSTTRQLETLIRDVGKARATEGQAADLTMLLVPVDSPGIDLGPMDHEVATLRIYAPTAGSVRGTLLWAETLRGQGDRPWPSQVHALVEQFKDRLSKR